MRSKAQKKKDRAAAKNRDRRAKQRAVESMLESPCQDERATYSGRRESLRDLGFKTYREYLKSPLWRRIRLAALDFHGKSCTMCPNEADTVHHMDYSVATLRGDNPRKLVPLCTGCHERIEFNAHGKSNLEEANRRLNENINGVSE